jgi:hypothetical protein
VIGHNGVSGGASSSAGPGRGGYGSDDWPGVGGGGGAGGAGYYGGGGGATGIRAASGGGGGGGSDFCSSNASVSGCSISSGAGTLTMAGAKAGDAEVTITYTPVTMEGCKKGGWQSFGVFKNQGDCVSYVATGGKNAPAGS